VVIPKNSVFALWHVESGQPDGRSGFLNSMKTRLWLYIWLLGILFPMAFLGKLWPDFGQVFNAIFAPDWTHIFMHFFLYAILGILLTTLVKTSDIPIIILVMGIGLLIACSHEGLQILTAGRWPGWPAEMLDLGVDLGGLAASLVLVRLIVLRKKSSI
jgi:hypothetical protein